MPGRGSLVAPPSRVAELSRGWSPGGHGDELVAFVRSHLGLLEDCSDSAHVHLVIDRAGLERCRLLGEKCVGGARHGEGAEQSDYLELVGCVALVVLLLPRLSETRMGRHVDAGFGAVDAGCP